MVQELKGQALFSGVRGQKPSDVETLCRYLVRLSHLVADFPVIQELDINPFALYQEGEGGVALDVRIRVNNGS